MKRAYIPLALLLTLLTACTNGWTRSEKELINSAAYSRMRVTKVDNTADSLLLRTPSTPLTHRDIHTPEFGRLVASMIETVCDPENSGVGIAAPQVGILRRVVAVQRMDKEGTPFEIYVNPEIVTYGADVAMGSEGCLSVPNLRGEVRRATSIVLRWRDPVDFSAREEHIEGFTAVIFQHEIDHLDGIIYTDRATTLSQE